MLFKLETKNRKISVKYISDDALSLLIVLMR